MNACTRSTGNNIRVVAS